MLRLVLLASLCPLAAFAGHPDDDVQLMPIGTKFTFEKPRADASVMNSYLQFAKSKDEWVCEFGSNELPQAYKGESASLKGYSMVLETPVKASSELADSARPEQGYQSVSYAFHANGSDGQKITFGCRFAGPAAIRRGETVSELVLLLRKNGLTVDVPAESAPAK